MMNGPIVQQTFWTLFSLLSEFIMNDAHKKQIKRGFNVVVLRFDFQGILQYTKKICRFFLKQFLKSFFFVVPTILVVI